MSTADPPVSLGRYAIAAKIAAGGMASIYLAQQAGAVGFSRLVAIKRLHSHYATQPEFMKMFLDEARLAARVRHPNVVETLDVVREGNETFIVLEYVDGESLGGLAASLREVGQLMPLPIAAAILSAVCRGLHAAHEARGADGSPLGIVHRDVSPQNVLVGSDGITRVTDFGVALARGRLSETRADQVKGKPAYMAPEQLSRDEVTRSSDLYAAGVILWELCAGRRAYDTTNEGALIARVITASIPRLSDVAPWAPAPIVSVVERALSRDPAQRFASAAEMAAAIEGATAIAPAGQVAAFVEERARDALAFRRGVAATLDQGAAPFNRCLQPDGPNTGWVTGPGQRPLALEPRPISMRPPIQELTHSRGSQTLTSPGPVPDPRSRVTLAIAFLLAMIAASAIAVTVTWLALQRTRVAADARVATASVAALPLASEESPPPGKVEDPSAARPIDSDLPSSPGTASAATDRIARPRGTSSSGAFSKLCDPPYTIDANGIRRVKRECF